MTVAISMSPARNVKCSEVKETVKAKELILAKWGSERGRRDTRNRLVTPTSYWLFSLRHRQRGKPG